MTSAHWTSRGAGLAAAGLVLFLSACGTPGRPSAGEPAAEARDRAARLEGYFPNTALVSHRGESVRFHDDVLRGRCVLIQFMYTTCDGT